MLWAPCHFPLIVQSSGNRRSNLIVCERPIIVMLEWKYTTLAVLLPVMLRIFMFNMPWYVALAVALRCAGLFAFWIVTLGRPALERPKRYLYCRNLGIGFQTAFTVCCLTEYTLTKLIPYICSCSPACRQSRVDPRSKRYRSSVRTTHHVPSQSTRATERA